MCSACSTNAERNSITTNMFSDYVNATHPEEGRDNSLSEIPKNVVIIEAAMFDKNNERCAQSSRRTKKLILL